MNTLHKLLPTLALLLASLALSGSVFAQTENAAAGPEQGAAESQSGDGANPVESGDAAEAVEEPAPAIDPEILRQAARDRVLQEQVIAELEENAGQNAYNAELAEAYLGLASTMNTLGQYDEAAAAYDKALQSVRISNGLYSEQQLPILELVMANYEVRQMWDDMDDTSHLILHVARRNFPIGDERRVQALTRLADWKLRVAGEDLMSDLENDSYDLTYMFRNEIEQLQGTSDYPDKNYHLAALYLSEAKAKLNMARAVMAQPLSDFRTGGSASTTQVVCRTIRLPNGRMEQICETVEVPNLDFYLDPSNLKNQSIHRNLLDSRKDIVSAYEILQGAESNREKQQDLLNQVQAVTTTYNTFVTENSL